MCVHDVADHLPSNNTLANINAPTGNISAIEDENDGTDDQHDEVPRTKGNMATPDSLNIDSDSETLVHMEHPLQYSPTHSNPDGFSPYNYSSSSSQPFSSPCMRLAPNFYLARPLLVRSSPPSHTDHNRLRHSLPLRIPINRQLRAVLSLPSSSFAASPASSTTSVDGRGPGFSKTVPKLRPDQLGFSEFGFTPLPLTATPSIEPRHARKLSDSRNTEAILSEVDLLLAMLDDECRGEFSAELGRLLGEVKREEGTKDASTPGRPKKDDSID